MEELVLSEDTNGNLKDNSNMDTLNVPDDDELDDEFSEEDEGG